MKKKISIVTPTYNEDQNIEKLIYSYNILKLVLWIKYLNFYIYFWKNFFNKIKKLNNSTLPITMNNISEVFDNMFKSKKLKLFRL